MRWRCAAFGLFLTAAVGSASIQPQMYCWSPDSELPVPCTEDGDDDGEEPETMVIARTSRGPSVPPN